MRGKFSWRILSCTAAEASVALWMFRPCRNFVFDIIWKACPASTLLLICSTREKHAAASLTRTTSFPETMTEFFTSAAAEHQTAHRRLEHPGWEGGVGVAEKSSVVKRSAESRNNILQHCLKPLRLFVEEESWGCCSVVAWSQLENTCTALTGARPHLRLWPSLIRSN